jgi:hypothetical protein
VLGAPRLYGDDSERPVSRAPQAASSPAQSPSRPGPPPASRAVPRVSAVVAQSEPGAYIKDDPPSSVVQRAPATALAAPRPHASDPPATGASHASAVAPSPPRPASVPQPAAAAVPPAPSTAPSDPLDGRGGFKDAFLAEIRKSKFVFYSAVVVQAQKIEVTADRVTFSFSSSQRALRDNCEQNRPWLESTAQKIAGRRVAVTAVQVDATGSSSGAAPPSNAQVTKQTELREQVLADPGVQALLEVFPAEIRDVEEM